MRYALALTVLVIASPTLADVLPHQDIKLAVETSANLAVIAKSCPEYHINRAKLASFVAYRGLRPGTIHPTFDDIYDRQVREMTEAHWKAPGDFCMFAWATYGADGAYPHLIDRWE